MSISLVDPRTKVALVERKGALVDPETGHRVAPIVNRIPRFVDSTDDYAEGFGFQWRYWEDTLSDERSTGNSKRELLRRRTHFDEYDLEGASILECGMGGGDDTEILLELPFAEIHSFDLSSSVERAAKHLGDPRLVISQASVFEIPYPDASFDFVFCHRVLQHTPDPPLALRSICRKVRPGGILFAHTYKRSWRYLMNYKYKYRWLTKRLPHRTIFWYVQKFGPSLHALNGFMYSSNVLLKALAYNFVPFEGILQYGHLERRKVLELARLVTFDALTPRYDNPMSAKRFCGIIESEGFRIEHLYDSKFSPVFCTAVKV